MAMDIFKRMENFRRSKLFLIKFLIKQQHHRGEMGMRVAAAVQSKMIDIVTH